MQDADERNQQHENQRQRDRHQLAILTRQGEHLEPGIEPGDDHACDDEDREVAIKAARIRGVDVHEAILRQQRREQRPHDTQHAARDA